MKVIGLYKIQSLEHPDRLYIGSSANVMYRWTNHLGTLRTNCHRNNKLQAHFNKYGEKDLRFSILEQCNKDSLLIREQYYIDILKPSFNICRKAGSPYGIKWPKESCLKLIGNKNALNHKYICSEETKKEISNSKKGIHASEESRQKMRKPKSEKARRNMMGHANNKGHIPWNKGLKLKVA